MDDDRYDLDDDGHIEYVLQEYGPEYAEEQIEARRGEIAQDYQTSGLDNATLAAHASTYPLAHAELLKAKSRLDAEEWDEAIFHAGRALDGYTSAVFIAPIRELLVAPFRRAFPHAKVKTETLLGRITGIESGYRVARVIIAATRAAQETGELANSLSGFINIDAPGNWCTRNNAVHRLADFSEDEARTFVANAEALLERLADPLEGPTQAAAAAAAAAERDVEAKRASRTSIGDF